MKANDLYMILEKDFVNESMSDIWFKYMEELKEYICDNFKTRSMGLVCDFTHYITKVYTAVFPTYQVMSQIIDNNVENAMLFVHHPSNWDITKKTPFYLMDKGQLKIFKQRNISIFCYHVPLDNFSDYSTSVALAKKLGIKITESFALSRGAKNGVIGTIDIDSIEELHKKFSEVIGHQAKLYMYGHKSIKDSKVAVVAGGGNDIRYVKEILDKGVNTLITGISSETYKEVHQYEKEKEINLLGGTHYSTEKFACQSMCEYFRKLGVEAEFIEGVPILEDM
ncbi:MAG: hypothetical protein FH751_09885 [Firmicutes bacterium]|nr:hypothetical protein [Bacillota bacterium]